MKVRSDRLPQNDFEINNIQGNECNVVFFDTKNHKEEKDENENISYEYDAYNIKTTYRSTLGADISKNYEKWYNYAIQYEKDVLATEIRAKRNKLLNESDKELAIDRFSFEFPEEITMLNILQVIKSFFSVLSSITNGKWAKYRQQLRDITKQEEFPYNVEFPKKPTDNE